MISLSRKLFFAVEAVMYIAYNASSNPVSSKEIAGKQKLPPRYLEQMMQRLVRAGILRGVRGPRGGYLLARERRRIGIAEICDILQKADAENPEEINVPSTTLGIRIVQPLWDQMNAQAMAHLKPITIADLCEKAETLQIRKTSEEKLDFSI
jgi:Rrf2 family iron-sulfur cluster assembly transcriptional regulator